jgi:two-component system response regulator MprA
VAPERQSLTNPIEPRVKAASDLPTSERIAQGLPAMYRQSPVPRLLVVDDEPSISSFLRMGLARSGFDVTVASDGDEALAAVDREPFDLIVLDLMLPGIDGVSVCRRLRCNAELMILMLTAADSVPQRVAGLEAGADDYLVKPFDFEELLARLRALLRRRLPAARSPELRAGPFVLDDGAAVVTRDGVAVELSRREYDLFKLFLLHPRQVLTRDVILDQVWGYGFYGDANIVDVYVRYLRNKLDPDRRFIQTVRGLGYRLVP